MRDSSAPGCRLRLPILALVVIMVSFGCVDSDDKTPDGVQVVELDSGGTVVINSATGAWDTDPAARWRVQEEVRIGAADGSGPDVFGRVGGVVYDDFGRVWILDRMANEIRVFDAAGNFVRTIGQQGAGPGEFAGAATMILGPNKEIWVEDSRLWRWERFDSAGTRIGGSPSRSTLDGGARAWTENGVLIEENRIATDDPLRPLTALALLRLDGDGELVPFDTVSPPSLPPAATVRYTQTGGGYTMEHMLPFAHQPRWLMSPAGDFWSTKGGGEYEIVRQDRRGDTILVVSREYKPISVSDSAAAEAKLELEPYEGMVRSSRNVELPTSYPPFLDFVPADDGSLWVRRHVGSDLIGYEVFDANGRFLGEVNAPPALARMNIRRISGDHIYAVDEDSLGVNYVVVFRVLKPTT